MLSGCPTWMGFWVALIILPARGALLMCETADVGWVLSQIMAVSLTLTVLRKSQHPSHGSFTDVIDPHWSAPDFVSQWQKYTRADTLRFRDTHAAQGQTTEGNAYTCLAIQTASHRHATLFFFFFATSRRFILGSLSHRRTRCCFSSSFGALISHFPMWRGHWSVRRRGEALYDSHLSVQGRPGIDLYEVSVMLMLWLVSRN